jgi:hypothetical protein
MRCEKLLDVVFKLDFRMDPRPIVSCPNKCQEKQQVLKSDRAKQSFKCIKAFRGVRRLQKHMGGERKNPVFHLRVGRKPLVEKNNRWTIASSNPTNGADRQNRSCSILWAVKQENVQPLQTCFFLTSPSIELTRS